MPDKPVQSPETKGRRSIIAASLLALSGGGTAVPAINALQGGSIPLAAVFGAYSVAAVVGAVVASRAAYWWLRLAKAERPREGVLQCVALSDAEEHMIYASVGQDPKAMELARAEMLAAREMKR
jgi:hypothetical protein